MPIHDLKEQMARLPHQPGVYIYSNAAGETLYVGKARSLRDRVRSYLGAYGTSPRHDALSRRWRSRTTSSNSVTRGTTSCCGTTKTTPICS
jgi:excinuclease UvrABC nuclease subunit